MKKVADLVKQNWSPVVASFKVLGSIAAVFICIYGATSWVSKTARDAVLNEKFLVDLGGRVRPICVFDSKGAIEVDLGASEYIDTRNIEVKPAPEIYGFRIVIPAKLHLNYPPLVSGLDVSVFPEKVERGKGHDWNVVLTPRHTVSNIITESGMDTNRIYRFKVEILH